MRKRILIIDPVSQNRDTYVRLFKAINLNIFNLITTSSLKEAAMFLTMQPINLIVINKDHIKESLSFVYKQALRYHPSVKFIFLETKKRSHRKDRIPQHSLYSDPPGFVELLAKANGGLI